MKQDLVTLTFEEGGLLSKVFPNYQLREQQVELAKEIQSTIEENGYLVAEAPTGVGKSLAALVPGFEAIMKNDRPVVVVTSNILLQSQYIKKDIPFLEKLYRYPVSPVLIKGRSNYLCPAKLQEFRVTGRTARLEKDEKQIIDVLEWARKTKTGDKAELPFVPRESVWKEFACVENSECQRKNCPLYQSCPYYQNRNKVFSSKLVVCNYSYLFHALEKEGMLPEGAQLFVYDEAHEVAGIGRDFLESKFTPKTFNHMVQPVVNMARRLHGELDTMTFMNDLDLLTLQLKNDTFFIHASLLYGQKKPSNKDVIMMQGEVAKEFALLADDVIKQLKEMRSFLHEYLMNQGLNQDIRHEWADWYTEEEIMWQTTLETLYRAIEERCDLLHWLFNPEAENPTYLSWVEPHGDQVKFIRKPFSAHEITRNMFQETAASVALSATLTVNQSFQYVKKDLAMPESTKELRVDSPFPLSENMLWYLPKDCPSGSDMEHMRFTLREMLRIATAAKGRTLCLFTSKKNLTEATEFFRAQGSGFTIVSQEDMPKEQMMKVMKEEERVIALGTRSFFTGIDIQGQALSAVLIDKLPFPMIGDPINEYLMDREHGFWNFTLPETIIVLKQGFGRLNRTAEDKGVVSVMDGRLASAGYKNRIFNSFDFPVKATRSIEEVEAYLAPL